MRARVKKVDVLGWNKSNGTAKLQFGLTKNRYNIRWIKPHKPDTKVEDYDSINISDGVSI